MCLRVIHCVSRFTSWPHLLGNVVNIWTFRNFSFSFTVVQHIGFKMIRWHWGQSAESHQCIHPYRSEQRSESLWFLNENNSCFSFKIQCSEVQCKTAVTKVLMSSYLQCRRTEIYCNYGHPYRLWHCPLHRWSLHMMQLWCTCRHVHSAAARRHEMKKWAEDGSPLMMPEWNQIPIHARQEVCVIQDGRPQITVLTPPAHTHRVAMEGNCPSGDEEKHSEMSKNKRTANTGKLQQIGADPIRKIRQCRGLWSSQWQHQSVFW